MGERDREKKDREEGEEGKSEKKDRGIERHRK